MDGDLPNFRLTIFVDGLEQQIDLAPQGEHGGFSAFIGQRDGIGFENAFEITGRRDGDDLVIEIKNKNGVLVAVNKTSYSRV